MQINDLIAQFVNSGSHERKKGRYYSSELYNLLRGKLKPKDFFKERKIDEQGVKNISTGVASEDYLTKVFEGTKTKCKPQDKKEIKITDEIVVVAKPDYVFDEFVLEVKCPVRELNSIPPWYATQCEAYYRAFKKDVFLGVIVHPFSVKTFKYTPNDELWEDIKIAIKKFHKKL